MTFYFEVNNLKRFLVSILLLAVIIFLGCSDEKQNTVAEFHGQTMGTTYSVKVINTALANDRKGMDKLKAGMDSVLVEVNNQMSTWQKDSEISQFNASESTDWFPVSSEFVSVVERALQIGDESNGALDVTVGGLVNLWGFGAGSKERDEVPSDEAIKEAQSLCGYQKLSFRKEEPALKKEVGGMYVDLSSIAKGYGVDKVAEYLTSAGYKNFLVEIGGEDRASGKNQNGQDWKIGVLVPDGSFDIEKVINLHNMSVATSGDYRNYFEKDGVRYSHTIDPRTGKPITHSLASVTVLHEDCTMADGYATAIDVMGPEEGLKFAQEKKLPVFLIVKTKDGFEEKMTADFEQLFNK